MSQLKITYNDKDVEQVDAQIAQAEAASKYNVTQHDAEALKAIDFGSVIKIVGQVCAAYAVAKPVIDFAIKFLLKWKPSWQKAIQNVQSAIETACGLVNPNPTA